MAARTLLLIASVVSSGLMAGLFFGWAVSVIPGTKVIDDQAYVTTMQNINREILNPLFIGAFLATPVLLAAAAIAHYRSGSTRVATMLIASAATYTVGVLAVTAGGNVPLNNALDSFDMATATAQDLRSRRVSYETPWNRWHNLRTLASIVSLALAAYASVLAQAD